MNAPRLVAIGAGLAVGAVVIYLATRGARKAAELAATSFNPASDQNLAYRGVNTVVQAATGQQGAILGTWLYDLVNPNQPDLTAKVAPKPAPPDDLPILDWSNPFAVGA